MREARSGRTRFLDRVSFRLLHRRLQVIQRRATSDLLKEVERNLVLGRSVVVEALAEPALREELQRLATQKDARYVHIECVCKDGREYARRLAGRPPLWEAVVAHLARDHRTPAETLILDTADGRDCVGRILAQLGQGE